MCFKSRVILKENLDITSMVSHFRLNHITGTSMALCSNKIKKINQSKIENNQC